jgi:hypothetical protein
MIVNVTAGRVTALDIIFPGLSAFDILSFQTSCTGSFPCDWLLDANNNEGELLSLDFITTPTRRSLVGFEGGEITGLDVFRPFVFVYDNL